jgi:membrane associated rhomboid family serine protease
MSHGTLRVCPGCRALVRADATVCPYCEERMPKPGGALARWFGGAGALTRTIIAWLVAVYCLQVGIEFLFGGGVSPGGLLMGAGADAAPLLGSNDHERVLAGREYWRLVTYMFLHAGLIHIGFNSFALYHIGTLAEMLWGKGRYWLVFFLSGVAGGLASAVHYGILLGQPSMSLGASGAVFGVLGMVWGFMLRRPKSFPEQVRRGVWQWVIYALLFGILAGADNAAHIGGLVAGGLAGYCMRPLREVDTTGAVQEGIVGAAWAAFAVTLVSVGVAGWFFASHLTGAAGA